LQDLSNDEEEDTDEDGLLAAEEATDVDCAESADETADIPRSVCDSW